MNGSPSSVRPGDLLAGKYRVERIIGEGGMGVVVAAHNVQLDQRVALKLLHAAALQNPDAVARFVREARTAARITSEHVVRVSDVGALENGAPYMVMEYLEGEDLDGWLSKRGALPIEQAVEFVLHACVAAADAHALGIVHRDLKPANLFCIRRTDGQLSIKVVDFGISKTTTGASASVALTKTSASMGTPLYMSPEQMQSAKAVDARTDIWALGVILFELLAHRVPFLADSVMELAVKIATERPPSLKTFRPDVAPALEAVIAKCLEKDPAKRYLNVGELAVALLPFAPKRAKGSVERISGIIQAAGLTKSALEVPVSPPIASPQDPARSLAAIGRTTAGRPEGKGALLGGVIIGLVLVGGLAGVVFLLPGLKAGHANEPPSPASATVGAETPPATPASEPPPSASAPVAAAPDPTASAGVAPAPAEAVPPAITAPRNAKTHALTGAPSARSTKTTPVRTSPIAPPPMPAAPSCDPPYTLNAAGHRVHKPECP